MRISETEEYGAGFCHFHFHLFKPAYKGHKKIAENWTSLELFPTNLLIRLVTGGPFFYWPSRCDMSLKVAKNYHVIQCPKA